MCHPTGEWFLTFLKAMMTRWIKHRAIVHPRGMTISSIRQEGFSIDADHLRKLVKRFHVYDLEETEQDLDNVPPPLDHT